MLSNLKKSNQKLYEVASREMKNIYIHESGTNINVRKLYVIESVCSLESTVDADSFKTSTVYQLAAVANGYLASGNDVKGYFLRNLKKEAQFWGFADL
jgi:hypothetical protein